MKKEALIERELLEKLERLSIHWQKSFSGLVGGSHTAKFAGAGQEFFDHRHFHHGDDLRGVNWRAYLRLEKLFMKMFHAEPRIPVRLLVDCSASMSTREGAKFTYARKLAAALAYVGLVRLDSITLHGFSSDFGEAHTCSGGRHRFGPVADFLSELPCQGRSSFLELVRNFIARYPQRGLLIIISDFLDDEDCCKPLQYLSDFGHELLLIQVWDDEDRCPPWDGELQLVDAETGALQDLEFGEDARARYVEAFDEHMARLQRLAESNGGRYAGLSTSVPIEDAIFGPVTQSRRVS